MSHPEGMQTFAARLASFESPKPKGKKRTSTKSKKTTSNWPLESPTPEDLAQAGFYHTATSSSPDNVTCFQCQKSLDEWEEGDNPFEEHLQFAPECPWAVTMAVERGIIPKDDDHDPLADDFVEMRIATFGILWPHENKRGWTCKVQKLVEAGWHYNPTPDEDDQTKCAYCSLCISCWEPKDKPIEEHKRRSPECSFFRLTQNHKKSRKSKKGRASKASRASTLSTFTAAKEQSVIHDEEMNIDDSIMTTATDMTAASTATNATSAAKKPGRGRKGTGRSTRGKKKEEEAAEDLQEPEDPYIGGMVASPGHVEKPRGKKRSSAVMMEEGTDGDDTAPPSKKRATRGRSTTARSRTEIQTEAEAMPVPEPQPELQPEPEVETEPSTQEVTMTEAEPEELSMPKRGAKGRATRGSSASRTTSAATARKVSGTRNASARKNSAASVAPEAPPAQTLDDAEIEAQLEADLERPLTDEEMLDAPTEDRPRVGRPSRQRRPTAKAASQAPVRKVSQEKPKPKSKPSPVEQEDAEEDELAQMDVPQARPSVPAEKLFANHYTEPIEDVELSGHETDTSVVAKPKAKRGAKKTSTISTASAAAPKPKRGRPPKKKVEEPQPEPEPAPEVEDENEVEPESILETQYPEHTELRFSSSFEEEPSVHEEVETKKAMKKTAPEPKSKAKATKQAKATATNQKGKTQKAMAASTQLDDPVEIEGREPSPRDDSPVPSPAPRKLPELESSPAQQAPPTPATAPGAFPSPTPSPQSSNAENEPPSSRPSQTRPPLAALTPNQHMTRVPLGSAAPSTPTRSIRRSIAGANDDDDGSSTPQWALNSAFPWRPIDIENVFLPSPESKRTKWFAAPDREKRSSLPLESSMDVKDKGKKSAAAAREREQKMLRMRSMLSGAEKQMTVEEWIRWNAERGEDKLRAECERVVGKFESEGIRAMKALEGLVVEEWA